MWWTVAKEATTSWSSHKDARQGAALAYYSVFSLGPIIVIAIAIAALFFGHDAVTSQVTSSLKDMLGETGAKAIESMLAGASRPAEGALVTILGTGALLFAAIGVVVQLKDALNVVWEVEESDESGLWHFARNYVLSFAAVLALGFLLLVSLLVTAGLAAAGKFVAPYMPEGVLQIVSLLVSFAVVALLFAMMFKWLPDVSVGWRDVWLGAFLTALFFAVGKAAIGFYIGKKSTMKTSVSFLAGATALLFPIDWPEPFGLVMIEAMACGTPVIAYRSGSMPEVVDEGITGFVVSNEEEAVRAIGRLHELDRRLVRAHFESRFSATRMAEEYVRHYKALSLAGEVGSSQPSLRQLASESQVVTQ
jgi:membrane protein